MVTHRVKSPLLPHKHRKCEDADSTWGLNPVSLLNHILFIINIIHLWPESPTPRPWTGTGVWSVRNWATQKEVIGRVFTTSPHHSYYPLTSCEISGGIRFSDQHEPYCELCLQEIWVAGSLWESSPNHPPPLPTVGSWKNCLPQKWSLMPKSLGTSDLCNILLPNENKAKWMTWGINQEQIS